MLEELADLGRRWREGENLRLPRVTLHLASGRELSGIVLDMGSDPMTDPSVLLHTPGPNPGQPDWDVAHVTFPAIQAVTVHDVPSQGRPPEGAPPPPSRLEVKRHVAALESALAAQLEGVRVTVAWEEDPEALRGLDDLVAALNAVLGDLLRDPDGVSALRAKVKQLQLGVAAEPKVSLSEGVLLVFTAQAHPRRMTRDQLREEIEAVL